MVTFSCNTPYSECARLWCGGVLERVRGGLWHLTMGQTVGQSVLRSKYSTYHRHSRAQRVIRAALIGGAVVSPYGYFL